MSLKSSLHVRNALIMYQYTYFISSHLWTDFSYFTTIK